MKKNIKIVITKNTSNNTNNNTTNNNTITEDNSKIINSYIDDIYKKDEQDIYNIQFIANYLLNIINDIIQNIIKKYIFFIILILLLFFYIKYSYTKYT
jgi:hypothetical protein